MGTINDRGRNGRGHERALRFQQGQYRQVRRDLLKSPSGRSFAKPHRRGRCGIPLRRPFWKAGTSVSDCILECRKISKYFPGIKALDEVDFKVRAGEVHALVGENGAGKSTLVKILTGIYRPDAGEILLDGRRADFRSPGGRAGRGHRGHPPGSHDVRRPLRHGEHLYGTPRAHAGDSRSFPGARCGAAPATLLAELELDIDPDVQVRSLSVAQRHMVEIVKALSHGGAHRHHGRAHLGALPS